MAEDAIRAKIEWGREQQFRLSRIKGVGFLSEADSNDRMWKICFAEGLGEKWMCGGSKIHWLQLMGRRVVEARLCESEETREGRAQLAAIYEGPESK